jgi:uncharacterized protein YecT (DUF1311 family)
MRAWLVPLVSLSCAAGGTAAFGEDEKVEESVKILMTLCVAGGSEATIRSNPLNELQIQTGSGQVTLERHEAQGLIAGLNNGVTSIEADEANRIRDCLLPYRDRIMETLLKPANAVPDLPSTTYIPPPDWPSLLAPPYRTDYASEADNFGVVPTIGLNPNVNNYTPNYINGGLVITTGELEHAMQTRMQFYLVDVLEGSHTPLPGAYRVAGAGMIDYQNDVAKQAWFINQLLGITGGSYDAPIVIYCAGVNCWESFNAATRAIIGGFSNIYWYRGGLGAWQASLGSQPSGQPAASRPGWCAYARKQSESTICANGALWTLDAQLGAVFQNRLNGSSYEQRQQLQREEQWWLAARDNCGANAGCLQNAYVSRINQLGAE